MEPYEIVADYFSRRAIYMREIEVQIKKAMLLKVVSKEMFKVLREVAIAGSSNYNAKIEDYDSVFKLLALRERNKETLSAFFYYFTRRLGLFDLYSIYASSIEVDIVAEEGKIVSTKLEDKIIIVAGDDELWRDVVLSECMLFLNGPYKKGLRVESIDFDRRIVVGRYITGEGG